MNVLHIVHENSKGPSSIISVFKPFYEYIYNVMVLCFCVQCTCTMCVLVSCSDRIDLINSIADLKLDNKRLQEKNKALQVQMENSEEHLKEIQTENQQLKQQIKEYAIRTCLFLCTCAKI